MASTNAETGKVYRPRPNHRHMTDAEYNALGRSHSMHYRVESDHSFRITDSRDIQYYMYAERVFRKKRVYRAYIEFMRPMNETDVRKCITTSGSATYNVTVTKVCHMSLSVCEIYVKGKPNTLSPPVGGTKTFGTKYTDRIKTPGADTMVRKFTARYYTKPEISSSNLENVLYMVYMPSTNSLTGATEYEAYIHLVRQQAIATVIRNYVPKDHGTITEIAPSPPQAMRTFLAPGHFLKPGAVQHGKLPQHYKISPRTKRQRSENDEE